MEEEIETKPEEILKEKLQTGFLDKIKVRKWKILSGLLGFLVLAGAVFGAYKLGQKSIYPARPEPSRGEPIEGPTPTPGLVATPTPDPTADWKTCNNKNYSFSIKYPANFGIDPSTCNYSIMDYNFVKDISVVNIFEDFRKNWLLTINAEKSTLGLDQWIKDKNLCPSSFESCSSQIAGPITNSTEVDLINRRYAKTDVIVKTNDTIFDFSLSARNPNTPVNSGIKNVLDQILSTFRFLPSAGLGQGE
ncbi:MAG TPA: hypothetical protein VMX76_01100 [Nevskiaceae bacterium]|nr:hypothetical protein [Nevskiaceae bacterium]